MSMGIKKIGVLGAGVMGAGIAQAAAQNGILVVLRDIKDEYTDGALARIEKQLTRSVEKGRLTEAEKAAALVRIEKTTDAGALHDVDLAIEAAPEDMGLKKQVFAEIDSICKPGTIFATNTSSMSITELATAVKRPGLFLGVHFFNPVPVMKLVEVISGGSTDPQILPEVFGFVERLGKTPVHVKKDSPGFIVNRLLVPYLNEAVRLMEEGVASPEDIDMAIRLGLNYPAGPFEMIDTGGVDLTVAVLDYFSQEFHDSGYAPRGTLVQMLSEGRTGRKAGEGFYKY